MENLLAIGSISFALIGALASLYLHDWSATIYALSVVAWTIAWRIK